MSSLLPTDILIVNRGGSSYQIDHETIMSTLQDTDLLIINRGGESFKITGADFKAGTMGSGYSLPPYGVMSDLDTVLSNTGGKIQFSLNKTTWSSSLTVPINTVYYVDWTSDIDSKVQGSSYSAAIDYTYSDLGTTKTEDIEIGSLSKVPDPFTLDPIIDTVDNTLYEADHLDPTGTNAPGWVWVTTDSSQCDVQIARGGWVTAPTSPGSVRLGTSEELMLRHKTNVGSATVTTTELFVGYGTGAGENESATFTCTNPTQFVDKPSITSPVSLQDLPTLTAALTSDAMTGGGGPVHVSSDWQIATDSGFSNIVWQVANSNNLTSVTSSALTVGGTYYARVRYWSSIVVSPWSDAVQFYNAFATSPSGTSVGTMVVMAGSTDTAMEVNDSGVITVAPGTYRISVWGGGGGSWKYWNGAWSLGGGGACAQAVQTFSSSTDITFAIGTGGEANVGGINGGGSAGTPGGGAGGLAAPWGGTPVRGGGGGGYSVVTTSAGMNIKAAGGGAGSPNTNGNLGQPAGSGNGADGAGNTTGSHAGTNGGGGGGEGYDYFWHELSPYPSPDGNTDPGNGGSNQNYSTDGSSYTSINAVSVTMPATATAFPGSDGASAHVNLSRPVYIKPGNLYVSEAYPLVSGQTGQRVFGAPYVWAPIANNWAQSGGGLIEKL